MLERGYLDAVEGELKSGKEATVYLGRTRAGLAAVKVYRDLTVRSFKNDARYRAGATSATPASRRRSPNGAPPAAARRAGCGRARVRDALAPAPPACPCRSRSSVPTPPTSGRPARSC
jgi:hypothetical protein